MVNTRRYSDQNRDFTPLPLQLARHSAELPPLPPASQQVLDHFYSSCQADSAATLNDQWLAYIGVRQLGLVSRLTLDDFDRLHQRLLNTYTDGSTSSSLALLSIKTTLHSVHVDHEALLRERLYILCSDWWTVLADQHRLPRIPIDPTQATSLATGNSTKPRQGFSSPSHFGPAIRPMAERIALTLVQIQELDLAWTIAKVAGDAAQDPLSVDFFTALLTGYQQRQYQSTHWTRVVYDHIRRWKIRRNYTVTRLVVEIVTAPQRTTAHPDFDVLYEALSNRARDKFVHPKRPLLQPVRPGNVAYADRMALGYINTHKPRTTGLYAAIIRGYLRINQSDQALNWYRRLWHDRLIDYRTTSVNAILISLAALKRPQDMLAFVRHMISRNVPLNDYTYRVLIQGSTKHDISTLLPVVEDAIQQGSPPCLYTGSTRIDLTRRPQLLADLMRAWAAQGHATKAMTWYCQYFVPHPPQGLTVLGFTTVITALGELGEMDHAYCLYQALVQRCPQGQGPTSVTWSALLNACIRHRYFNPLDRIAGDIEQQANRTRSSGTGSTAMVALHVYVDLARAYAINGHLAQVSAIVTTLLNRVNQVDYPYTLSIHEWNGLIWALGRVGLANDAWKLYEALIPTYCALPDMVTFSTMLNMALENKRLELVPFVIADLDKASATMAYSDQVCVDLIEICAHCQDPVRVLAALQALQASTAALSTRSCNRIILGLGMIGQWQWALQLFGDMPPQGQDSKNLTHGSQRAASSTSNAGTFMASSVIASSRLAHAPVNLETYHHMLQACLDNCAWDSFTHVLADLHASPIPPDEQLYHLEIQGLCRQGQPDAALALIADMHQQTASSDSRFPTAAMYTTLIRELVQPKGPLSLNNRQVIQDAWQIAILQYKSMVAHRVPSTPELDQLILSLCTDISHTSQMIALLTDSPLPPSSRSLASNTATVDSKDELKRLVAVVQRILTDMAVAP
ncbi:hypothetical protein H4R34_003224 [Dimargaris verticillata]|uniref:Pentacotripeptide-repeat region of PRORP domain-containing protein n=1 Tax=Dimargaris verticillata TaxID=2761393 RepID=A0A9W8E989_9FUNG|nr:hypothetical protein H4R34_003224 [Dimargaris verticillata]